MKLLLLLVHLLFAAQDKPKCTVTFYKIDNRAEILVNEKVVYNSGVVDGNPDMEEVIGLDKHLTPGQNTITIKLMNGSEYLASAKDPHWEIEYALLNAGYIVDDVWEYADDSKQGVVFEKTYQIKIE